MLRELQVLLRRSFRHPDESIKRGLIYTSVCDHSGTATVNGVARSELTPPCSNTRSHANARTHVQHIPFATYARTAELAHKHMRVLTCKQSSASVHTSHRTHTPTRDYYCL